MPGQVQCQGQVFTCVSTFNPPRAGTTIRPILQMGTLRLKDIPFTPHLRTCKPLWLTAFLYYFPELQLTPTHLSVRPTSGLGAPTLSPEYLSVPL